MLKLAKPLVIVESPTKVRTLKKYIGKEFNVTATSGHIMDLPQKEIGVDIENNFKPKYVVIPGKSKIIKSLKSAAKNASDIYLAPDPDREGEAIAWHTAELLKKKGRKFYRVLFHELTKNAIVKAVEKPIDLDLDKYDAQQVRRILDRIVGYQISPVLWDKVQRGLSAGRVQSVALRIICEREYSIFAFVPEEYWSITAHLKADNPPVFMAKLVKKSGKKIKIDNGKTADDILKYVSKAEFIVDKIVLKTVKRNPLPPFITSKLQQEAIRKLRFSAKKTMMVAQQLYEGVDMSHGEPVGLITYMRTDSLRISKEAAEEAIAYVKQEIGESFAPDAPRFFKNKNKAQDAHEAIRPTTVHNTPDKLSSYLSPDQLLLYTLIWKRFVASQMTQALVDQKTVAVKAGVYTFTATGSTVKFPGFMRLYMSVDEQKERDKTKQVLPELSEGMVLDTVKIDPKQHFTMPPPRFTEASLVKELEENGIGRPSTYAAILSTIKSKGYVDFVKKQFKPSELGFIVNDLLVANFPEIIDVNFTAKLENSLDRVEAADEKALTILKNFYESFEKKIAVAKDTMLSVKGVGVPTDLKCPECEKKLHIKVGRNGLFLSCEGYPKCSYSRNYLRDEKGAVHIVEPSFKEAEGQFCEKCNKQMVIKQGMYGEFLACSGYPDCKNTRSVKSNGKRESLGISCPVENCKGEIIQKFSKRGKVFYGCSSYPDCDFAIWDKPVEKKCPECGFAFLVEKETKRSGKVIKCTQADCKYKEPA